MICRQTEGRIFVSKYSWKMWGNIAVDWEKRVLEKITQCGRFSLQLTESTDVSNTSQLKVSSGFSSNDETHKTLLFFLVCEPLKASYSRKDILPTVNALLNKSNGLWGVRWKLQCWRSRLERMFEKDSGYSQGSVPSTHSPALPAMVKPAPWAEAWAHIRWRRCGVSLQKQGCPLRAEWLWCLIMSLGVVLKAFQARENEWVRDNCGKVLEGDVPSLPHSSADTVSLCCPS